jgi:flagellin-like protein
MRKGVTPIIAIIILLLITIALAATAWTYLSGLLGGYTRGVLVLVDTYCEGLTTSVVILRNGGTNTIGLDDCTGANAITGTTYDCGSLTITRTDGVNTMAANLTKTELRPQETVVFKDTQCADGGPNICAYRFSTAGGMGAISVNVPCG